MIIDLVLVKAAHFERENRLGGELCEVSVTCPSATDKRRNNISLLLFPQLRETNFYNAESYVVFQSEIQYKFVTDGRVTVEDLYVVFESAMLQTIGAYQASAGFDAADKKYEPMPIADLREKLQQIADSIS